MSMLNEFRVQTSQVERKVAEAQAKLHNGRQLLSDILREDATVRGSTHDSLTLLSGLLHKANLALNEVN